MPNIEPITRGDKMPRGGKREGAGRPARIKDTPTTHRHMVRLTTAEYELLQAKAASLDMTLSEYLRFKALKEE